MTDIKKDLFNSMYVMLGTGSLVGSQQVQAYFNDDMSSELGKLRKGARLTVDCVGNGLMGYVSLIDCQIVK